MTEPRGLLAGDCRERLAELPENSIDALITDPPYELALMGRKWDSTGIAFDPAMWAECLRVLKPGGHLLAFGAARRYHRLACAVEDAGADVRGMLAWINSEGMPKTHQQLKPAVEPVVLARKPFRGSEKANIDTWGTGGLNTDACRIPGPAGTGNWAGKTKKVGYEGGWNSETKPNLAQNAAGRYPSDVLLDESAAAELGEASMFFYVAKAKLAEREHGLGHLPANAQGRRNTHVSCKPVALMRYLIRLACPPGGLVCDPFLGSGTTAVAAVLEGASWVGCELTEEYLPIIAGRVAQAQVDAAAGPSSLF